MEDKNYWWYKKTYDFLVETRKSRGTKKKKGDGFNRHHIIPKCIGGEDVENNYVLLTFREHLIAHMLLVRLYPNENGLKYSLLRMIQSSHSDRKENTYKVDKTGKNISFTISTKFFEELRLASVNHLRTKISGTTLSDETKNKISDKHLGMKYSEEHKKNLSLMRKGKKSKSRFVITNTITKKVYYSMSECIRSEKVSQREILSSKKYIVKELYKSTRGKRIQGPDGTIYKDLEECSRETGFYKTTISRWLKSNKRGYKYLD